MTYDPSRPGIPTLYNGIQFRSRLEAKWAAFFDLLGWEYEYEPFDLDGWIPDFLIKGKELDILVEVKPVTRFPDDVASKILRVSTGEFYDDRLSPFDVVRMGRPLLIVGASIRVEPIAGSIQPFAQIGWFLDYVAKRVHVEPIPVEEWTSTYWSKASVDLLSGEAGLTWHPIPADVVGLWREAGNLTQWKGKRSVSR